MKATDLHILPAASNANQQCLLVQNEGERAGQMHFAHLEQRCHVVVDDRSWHYGLLAWRRTHPHATEVVCLIRTALVDFVILRPEHFGEIISLQSDSSLQ